jgi:hypothetical protein
VVAVGVPVVGGGVGCFVVVECGVVLSSSSAEPFSSVAATSGMAAGQ